MSLPSALPSRRQELWPLVGALAGIALTVSLGNWQLGRAQEKRALKAQLEARAAEPPIAVPAAELAASDVEWRPVEAHGVFEPRHAVFVDNRIHQGVPGYHVVMPLRIAGSKRHVLVNRGWVARTADRSHLPDVATPSQPVTVRGLAVIPGKRTLELSEHVMEERIWQNLTIERYREARPIAIQPFMIQQENALDDGLVRAWQAPDMGLEKHYGYAFQWYALAATILIFYAVTRFRRRRKV